MKILLSSVLAMCLFLSGTASAFELQGVMEDTSFVDNLGTAVEDDKAYLRSVANSYSDRYFVGELQYADITSIDEFYSDMSAPVNVSELDDCKVNFNMDCILSENLKKRCSLIKTLGGISGVTVEFEPVMYYTIYRNITLVGGYTKYNKIYDDLYEAYWQGVCALESITKEIVSYEKRMALVEKYKELYEYINNDKHFKIFILVDEKINSVWERSSI